MIHVLYKVIRVLESLNLQQWHLRRQNLEALVSNGFHPVYNNLPFVFERSQSKWGDYYILGENRLKLTPQGFVFADAIAVDLMIPAP
jgi:hypothetical protein